MALVSVRSFLGQEAWPGWLLTRPEQVPPSVCWLLATVLAAFQLGPEWGTPYLAGCDETQALMAGTRLHRGQGFTGLSPYPTWPSPVCQDLAEPAWRPMTNWPPGHALLHAGILSATNGDLDTAGNCHRLLKTLAALLGAYGWLRLANAVLTVPGVLLLAVLMLSGLHGYNIRLNVPEVGPSHLFMWALMPWWLRAGLLAVESRRPRDWLSLGLWAGLALQLRYQSIYLSAVSGIFAVLLAGGGLRERCRMALLAGMPGALSFGGLLLFNRLIGSAGFWITAEVESVWNWVDVWQECLATVWLGFGFFVPEIVTKFKPSWRNTAELSWASGTWYGLMVVSGLLGGMAVRRGTPLTENCESDRSAEALRQRRIRLLLLVGVMVAGMSGLLFAATLRLPPGSDFWPTGEGRYYTEALPAVGLCWLVMWSVLLESPRLPGGRWGGGAGRALTVVLVMTVGISGIIMAFFDGRIHWRHRRVLRDTAESRQGRPSITAAVVEHLCRNRPVEDHLILDSLNDLPRWLYWRQEFTAAAITDTSLAPQARASRATYVVIVMRWDLNKGGKLRRSWRTQDAWQTACFLFGPHPPEAFRFSDGPHYCQVFAGVVLPFEPGQRPPAPPRETEPPIPMDLYCTWPQADRGLKFGH